MCCFYVCEAFVGVCLGSGAFLSARREGVLTLRWSTGRRPARGALLRHCPGPQRLAHEPSRVGEG